MTKIRLDKQVQGKLPANSLYDWDETIGWNKSLTWMTTLAESYKSWDDVRTYMSLTNTSWYIRWGNAWYIVVAGNNSWTGDKNVYLIPWTWWNTLVEAWNVWIWTPSPGEKLEVNWNITPSVDNSYTLWKSWNRWSSVWAANGTIQTSDRRTKTDIAPTYLGLDFIDKLNPVSYKWIEWGNTVTYEEVEVEKEVQETEIITYTEETIKLIDWKYVKVVEEKTKENKIFDEFDLYDEAWEVIGKHQVPRMVTKLVKEQREVITSTPWKRTHFWFIAQEVEEALAGIDFGWLVIDENWQYALRYDQFISPLVAAVKELKARVEELENK